MRAGSITAWLLWILAAIIAAGGLRQYRVDNDLGEWFPDAATRGPIHSYCVVGCAADVVPIEELSGALRALPTVAWCVDPVTVATFGQLRGVTPEDFVRSPDGTFAGVFCFPKADVSDENFIRSVRTCVRQVAGPRIDHVHIGGPAVFHVELNAWSQRGLPGIVAAITVAGMLLLVWVTRRPRTALAATGAVVLSQIVLVGGVSWLRIPMNMSLSMVPPMMLALGFSYAAHRATQRVILCTLILCGATTALGIGCFLATAVVPIRQFALFGVIGVALVWAAVVTLVPHAGPGGAAERRWLRGLRAAVVRLATQRARTIRLLAGSVSILALAAALLLRFESDPLRYFPANATVVRDFEVLNKRLTGMLPFQIRVVGDRDAAAMLAETPGLRKYIDVTDLAGGADHVYWCLADNDALPALRADSQRWEAFERQNGCHVKWSGVAARLAAISEMVTRTAVISLPAMALLAALVVALSTRSIRLALVSAWVNTLPVLVLILLAGVTRWPLGLPALMIGAIAVGMAIDDTIHVTRGFSRGWSVRRTLLRCWRPCVGSTLVAAVCLAFFAAAPFRPTAQFGIMLSLASVAALAGDLLVLPAMWTQHKRSNPRL